MAVVFPNAMACVSGNTLVMPYWDHALDVVDYYNAPAYSYLGSNIIREISYNSGMEDGTNNLSILYSWINWLNPDWRSIYDLTTVQVFGPSSAFTTYPSATPITRVEVAVSPTIAHGIDFWWGTTVFAKFGFLALGLLGEAIWINFLNMALTFSVEQAYYGVSFCGYSGQEITVTTYGPASLPYIIFAGAPFPYPSTF